jgi:hypothetical protein
MPSDDTEIGNLAVTLAAIPVSSPKSVSTQASWQRYIFQICDLTLSMKPATPVPGLADLMYGDPSVVGEVVSEVRTRRSTIVHVFAIPDDTVDRCHASLALHNIHSQNLKTLGTVKKDRVWIVAGESKVHVDRFILMLADSQKPQKTGYNLMHVGLVATLASMLTWSALAFA